LLQAMRERTAASSPGQAKLQLTYISLKRFQ
jgi:hypothetical protein